VNPPELIVTVLVIVFAFSLLKRRMDFQHRSGPPAEDSSETLRLREQVKQMQDRIRVLERIVTDRGVETASQIEALRERDQIGAEDKA
jgi:hypothetical protein